MSNTVDLRREREHLVIRGSLYQPWVVFEGDADDHTAAEEKLQSDLRLFFLGGGSLNGFCARCQEPTSYIVKRPSPIPDKIISGVTRIDAHCQRMSPEKSAFSDLCNAEFTAFFRLITEYGSNDGLGIRVSIEKIGQYPSRATMEAGQTEAWLRKQLGDESREEYHQALGLHSHGIGAGALVYLRRIIERLVETYHQRAMSTGSIGWDEGRYQKSRFGQKVQLLIDYFPEDAQPVLDPSGPLFSFISKGIHELSETECRALFEPARDVVEIILRREFDNARLAQSTKKITGK